MFQIFGIGFMMILFPILFFIIGGVIIFLIFSKIIKFIKARRPFSTHIEPKQEKAIQEESVVCEYCGGEIKKEESKCSSCGAKIVKKK